MVVLWCFYVMGAGVAGGLKGFVTGEKSDATETAENDFNSGAGQLRKQRRWEDRAVAEYFVKVFSDLRSEFQAMVDREDLFEVSGTQPLSHQLRVLPFIKRFLGKTNVEGFHH